MEISKPLLRRKLHISHRPYYLKRTQEEGEKDLAKICKKARREDSWIHYGDTCLWLHLPNEHEESQGEGGMEMSVLAPPIYESPLGSAPIHYHIHPDLLIQNILDSSEPIREELQETMEDILYAWNSFPSNDDFSLVTNQGQGYEHRIVTSRGITLMQSGTPPPNMRDITPFFRSHIKLNAFQAKGFHAALEEAISEVDSKLGNTFTIKYKAL